MPRCLISAAHKSSGKTTFSVGACAALRRRGLVVQPFKKGPDYIDPMWLEAAAGRPCYNLDFHTMSPEAIAALHAQRAGGANLSLVEGNKGLHDGVALDGRDSNAALAKHLGLPVVLVVDTRGITRGIAPLLTGYAGFDSAVGFAGVVLNFVAGPRHEAKLRAAVEHYTDLRVLGAIGRDDALAVTEAHLGLHPPNEVAERDAVVARLGRRIASEVDLDVLLAAVAERTPDLPAAPAATLGPDAAAGPAVRIGVARDAAFGFYYPDDLEALERAGARIVAFDTLRDQALPDVDGVFIGGGFPERHMEALERNGAMRASVRAAAEGGLPVYAECGGLMYLARCIRWRGRSHDMAGVLPADVVMHRRPMGRGYVLLEQTGQAPWSASCAGTRRIPAHEFHHSSLEGYDPSDFGFAYRVLRGHGVDGRHDGLLHRNVLASYAHLRCVPGHDWASAFVAFARRERDARAAAAGGPGARPQAVSSGP
jgi:cobyrinic acid a,c-diamide synthase